MQIKVALILNIQVSKSIFHSNNYLSTQHTNNHATYFGAQCGVLSENEKIRENLISLVIKIFKTFKTIQHSNGL